MNTFELLNYPEFKATYPLYTVVTVKLWCTGYVYLNSKYFRSLTMLKIHSMLFENVEPHELKVNGNELGLAQRGLGLA